MKKTVTSSFRKFWFASFIALISLISACNPVSHELMDGLESQREQKIASFVSESVTPSVSPDEIPPYSGMPYIALSGNMPGFQEGDLTTESFEYYGPLDSLGRCTAAMANVGMDLMPTEKREGISQVRPTGWQSVKYDWIDGKSLYNRCHLIGFQLTGENANENNLITGTRYMNVDGMLPFENLVADYVKETGNHVLYRVTPIFQGSNLVADGVQMEGMSVEDKGESILFNVFVYNVQPGVEIDYATGNNWAEGSTELISGSNSPNNFEENSPNNIGKNSYNSSSENAQENWEKTYILNTNTQKFHNPDCSGVPTISEYNRQTFIGSRSQLIADGYEPCGRCNP